jgi:glucose/mannose-6-phosphate isomerase
MLMKEHIANFTKQMREAITIGENAVLTPSKNQIRNVLVTGLGGSGIGGTIIAQITDKELKVPMFVNKDYFLPAFVNENTLVIVSSYSGNTEETVQAMDAALARGAKIVCVTAGGKITAMAKEKGCDLISIPGGMPPRACFGYSALQLLYILQSNGLIGDAFRKDLQDTIALLDAEEEVVKAATYKLAGQLIGKIPAIYCEARYEGVAVRLRQQINENSKMLCWHHVLPEMNHNELVGWTEPHPDVAVLMFRNEDDFVRTQKRLSITSDVVKKFTPHFFEIHSKGKTQLQRTIYLLHYGDWLSWYIAEIKKIDATEVNVIDFLKGELASV